MTRAEIETYLLGADLAGFDLVAGECLLAAHCRASLHAGVNHAANLARLGREGWEYWVLRGFTEADGATRR